MAMHFNGGRSRGGMVSEINVTPFVDVMLVLLIIFMVAAPMMIQGIDVRLPDVSARPIPASQKRLVVSVTEDRRVFVNDQEAQMETLGPTLASITGSSQDHRGVILRADKKTEYGLVAQVMGVIREAGIEQIGMVTEPVSGVKKSVEN